MATKKRPVSTSSKKENPQPGPIPEIIYAQASPHSLGGVSMFSVGGQINASTVQNFSTEPDLQRRAAIALQEAGFQVLQISPQTINIAGSRELFEQAFNTTITAEERPVIKPTGEDTATFLECPATDMPGLIPVGGTRFSDLLEGVAIEEPRYFMAPSMFAPTKSYWHLRVPGDVSLGCNADKAHRGGITGKGIKVAMVDSGHYKHPFFTGRGYRVAPVTLGPAASNPLADESGHGTGESANIFAVAPDVDLLPVKINFVNSVGAFNTAVGLSPHIITCSWGSSKQNPPLSAADQTLAAAIATAVASGIVVIFSAGNGHYGFPGQHPDVISAGGVYMKQDGSLTASDYASGFLSAIYPNRRVPDLSGLVGMRPKAIYIMLPLEPSDDIDVGNGGGTHPNGDETATNDGWAAFSGTSAAAPQLAGAAALVKQACGALTPKQVRDILMRGARDVTTGNCHPATGANPATAGPDLATGTGLVDAHRSVMLAKVQCLGPITIHPPIVIQPPVQPPVVVQPPVQPGPIQPGPGPIQPGPGPIQPGPIQPGPVTPVQPIRPIAPIINPGPVVATPQSTAAGESSPTPGLSQEDVEALHEMIIHSDFEIDQ